MKIVIGDVTSFVLWRKAADFLVADYGQSQRQDCYSWRKVKQTRWILHALRHELKYLLTLCGYDSSAPHHPVILIDNAPQSTRQGRSLSINSEAAYRFIIAVQHKTYIDPILSWFISGGQLACQLNIMMLRSKPIGQTFIYSTGGIAAGYLPGIRWSLSGVYITHYRRWPLPDFALV